ncbi:hypothetical protein [Ciceribacter ferrooxidans]|uniref:DNA-binding protein n=1 Tax=Ciceribacter ferrooxidans TaxID=2509717 RepID=A0A4Q2SX93_9HYPH|nr:hypothetical protein [Ciceribacter ferrooxidans]RYC10051.1 hypothetical protein EUU22_18415 [Ciceribacter ferrooxidans]
MEKALASNLLQLASAYGAATSLSDSTIGRLCAADGRFFSRIRDGATFTVKKYDEVIAWFSRQWPEGAEWPADVPRPVIIPEAAE